MYVTNHLKPTQLYQNRFRKNKDQHIKPTRDAVSALDDHHLNLLKFKSFYYHRPPKRNVSNLCSFKSNHNLSDNPFFSGIEAMPDIRPRKKSIPLVSELVLQVKNF